MLNEIQWSNVKSFARSVAEKLDVICCGLRELNSPKWLVFSVGTNVLYKSCVNCVKYLIMFDE